MHTASVANSWQVRIGVVFEGLGAKAWPEIRISTSAPRHQEATGNLDLRESAVASPTQLPLAGALGRQTFPLL